MKYFLYNEKIGDSNAESNSYIHINNFGLFENLNYDVGVDRPAGRMDYQLLIMLEGSGIFTIDSKNITLNKNQGILYRPYEKQQYEIKKGNSYLWIHFSGTEVHSLLQRLNFPYPFIQADDSFNIKNTFTKMTECTAYEENVSIEMLNSYLILLLSGLCVKNTNYDPGISKVISVMKLEGFKGMSVKEYADIAGVSENHFIRKFRKYTKLSPNQYKAKLLTEKACKLLSDYTLNISQVADLLGFDDSLYFSRFFKKNTGISPSDFKNKIFM